MSDPTDATHQVLVTTESHEPDEDESPPLSPSKRTPEALPIGANKAKKTQDNCQTGLKYINLFLEEKGLPKFDDLTNKDVEADHCRTY